MANSDKNIIITPNINQSSVPSLSFIGAGNSSISLRVQDDSFGTLSFQNSGTEQFFAIDSNLTGLLRNRSNIFRVNARNGQPALNANCAFNTTVDLCQGEGNVRVHGHNYIVSGCYTMTEASKNTIVSNNNGYINFELRTDPVNFCTDSSVIEVVNSGNYGLRFWKDGVVFFYMSQDIISSNANSYEYVDFYITGQEGASGTRGRHLITSTNGQWDGLVVYQSFRVRSGDTLEVRIVGNNDITAMDTGTWSYYSVLFHAIDF